MFFHYYILLLKNNKYNNKLIILDNASCRRNEKVKDVINRHNKLLHSVVYQHYTNCIENYFSILKNYLCFSSNTHISNQKIISI